MVNKARVWIIDPMRNVTPGFYRIRLVRNGPWVPCRCWIEPSARDPDTGEATTDEHTRLIVEGREVEPFRPPYEAVLGEPISEAEYDYMLALSLHVNVHEHEHPAASPGAPVNLLKAPSPF